MDPVADVVALGIKLFALRDRIKNAEVGRGVGAAAGRSLPAEGVAGQVGIDQCVPEPLGTNAATG